MNVIHPNATKVLTRTSRIEEGLLRVRRVVSRWPTKRAGGLDRINFCVVTKIGGHFLARYTYVRSAPLYAIGREPGGFFFFYASHALGQENC